MLINRENYELFVADFLDGKLSAGDNEVFARFLNDNPDILEEVMNIEQIRLLPGDIIYPDKDILRKTIKQESLDFLHHEFRDYCIAFLEGDLSLFKIKEFKDYLKENPGKNEELESFRKTYLKPDLSIRFMSKSKLKKLTITQKRTRIISLISGAAAILVIAMILIQPGSNLIRQLISGKNPVKDSQNEITSGNITEEKREEDKTNQIIKPDSEEIRQEIGVAQASGIKPAGRITFSSGEEIQGENNMIRGNITIKPITSLQAYLEVQVPDFPEKLSLLSPKDLRTSGEYLSIVEFAGERFLNDIIRKNGSGQDNKLTFWDLAYTSFNNMDKISEGSYALNREFDEEGSVIRITFETPGLGLSLPLKSSNNSQ